jgi:hypothetical protein
MVLVNVRDGPIDLVNVPDGPMSTEMGGGEEGEGGERRCMMTLRDSDMCWPVSAHLFHLSPVHGVVGL